MARRKKAKSGEQLDLIDLTPENAKPLKRAIRLYQEAQAEGKEWKDEEKLQKQRILGLVKEAGLRPDADGVIQFRLQGITIKITPRDSLIQVKVEGDSEDRA